MDPLPNTSGERCRHCGAGNATPTQTRELLSHSAPASVRRRPSELPLTGRQREVAELVADGLTNREIAERLYVTLKTVEAHVSHIRIRLGAANRAAVAGIVARAQSHH